MGVVPLTSYYSVAMQDWLTTSTDTGHAWAATKGYTMMSKAEG